jgi:hypothetical protein
MGKLTVMPAVQLWNFRERHRHVSVCTEIHATRCEGGCDIYVVVTFRSPPQTFPGLISGYSWRVLEGVFAVDELNEVVCSLQIRRLSIIRFGTYLLSLRFIPHHPFHICGQPLYFEPWSPILHRAQVGTNLCSKRLSHCHERCSSAQWTLAWEAWQFPPRYRIADAVGTEEGQRVTCRFPRWFW